MCSYVASYFAKVATMALYNQEYIMGRERVSNCVQGLSKMLTRYMQFIFKEIRYALAS